MINIMSTGGHTAYNIKEFAIDTKEDLDYLPLDVPMGSVAICIEDSSVYMLNSSGEWVEI